MAAQNFKSNHTWRGNFTWRGKNFEMLHGPNFSTFFHSSITPMFNFLQMRQLESHLSSVEGRILKVKEEVATT